MPEQTAISIRSSATIRLGRTPAFWLLAVTLALLLFASSAPSPLYVVYQAEWGFSAITLTAVFAVYALALLVALLVTGSLSDHLGRRPTLLLALAIETVGMLLFAEARGVPWLFAGRVLQGIATGIAMAAISAALLDLQPTARPRLGPLVAATAPMAGLAAGALASGLLVEFAANPTHLIYWLLLGAFALLTILACAIPETVARRPTWRSTFRPRVAVPPSLRGAFIATIPCLTATWALGGLILSLGPSLIAKVLGDGSHVAGALPIFIMAGVSAIASVGLQDTHARTAARGGLLALILGISLSLVALGVDSTPLFLIATAIAGLGFGPAFAGAFRALSSRAPSDRRAALVAAIFVASYLAYSLPALAAGVAVTQLGLHETANVYGAVLIALAVIALALSHRLEDLESPSQRLEATVPDTLGATPASTTPASTAPATQASTVPAPCAADWID